MNAVSSVALLQIAAGLGKLSWLNQYQKDSALARWYRGRTENANGSRKKLIVALARKLLIALWHFVRDGVVPEGVVLRPAQ
jgi:transposase